MPAEPDPPPPTWASSPVVLGDDSPFHLLRSLETERGRDLSEAEYRQMRHEVIEELAHGARLRPFTVFTFGAVALLLGCSLMLGLWLARSETIGVQLAVVSGLALAAWAGWGWSYWRGVKRDARVALPDRLRELDELCAHGLITPGERERIHAGILMRRQQNAKS